MAHHDEYSEPTQVSFQRHTRRDLLASSITARDQTGTF
jgi:hypothetical protein